MRAWTPGLRWERRLALGILSRWGEVARKIGWTRSNSLTTMGCRLTSGEPFPAPPLPLSTSGLTSRYVGSVPPSNSTCAFPGRHQDLQGLRVTRSGCHHSHLPSMHGIARPGPSHSTESAARTPEFGSGSRCACPGPPRPGIPQPGGAPPAKHGFRGDTDAALPIGEGPSLSLSKALLSHSPWSWSRLEVEGRLGASSRQEVPGLRGEALQQSA